MIMHDKIAKANDALYYKLMMLRSEVSLPKFGYRRVGNIDLHLRSVNFEVWQNVKMSLYGPQHAEPIH